MRFILINLLVGSSLSLPLIAATTSPNKHVEPLGLRSTRSTETDKGLAPDPLEDLGNSEISNSFSPALIFDPLGGRPSVQLFHGNLTDPPVRPLVIPGVDRWLKNKRRGLIEEN